MSAIHRWSIAALSFGIAVVAGCAVDSTSPSPSSQEPAPTVAEVAPPARLRVPEHPNASDPRVDLRQAGPWVVRHDEARYAVAFEDGPVGRPKSISTMMPIHDPKDPGDTSGPTDPPPAPY